MLIDTNILVYAVNSSDPHHKACASVVRRAFAGTLEAVVFPQVLREFYSVVTSARLSQKPLTPEAAITQVEDFQTAIELMHPNAKCHAEWLNISRQIQPNGATTFDVSLIAQMKVHGIDHVCTVNAADFDFPGIFTVSPNTV